MCLRKALNIPHKLSAAPFLFFVACLPGAERAHPQSSAPTLSKLTIAQTQPFAEHSVEPLVKAARGIFWERQVGIKTFGEQVI
jgi:hypothetical protein